MASVGGRNGLFVTLTIVVLALSFNSHEMPDHRQGQNY
jgi:hypothetical protein